MITEGLESIEPENRFVAVVSWNDKSNSTPLQDLSLFMVKKAGTQIRISSYCAKLISESSEFKKELGISGWILTDEEIVDYLNIYFQLPRINRSVYRPLPIVCVPDNELPAKEVIMSDKMSLQIACEADIV